MGTVVAPPRTPPSPRGDALCRSAWRRARRDGPCLIGPCDAATGASAGRDDIEVLEIAANISVATVALMMEVEGFQAEGVDNIAVMVVAVDMVAMVAVVENIGAVEVAAEAAMEAVASETVAAAVDVDNAAATAALEFTTALATGEAADFD